MKKHRVPKAPLVLIVAGTMMLIAGIASGEHLRVLEQAVSICLSCIGIG